jgi:hypothetical protein
MIDWVTEVNAWNPGCQCDCLNEYDFMILEWDTDVPLSLLLLSLVFSSLRVPVLQLGNSTSISILIAQNLLHSPTTLDTSFRPKENLQVTVNRERTHRQTHHASCRASLGRRLRSGSPSLVV